MVPLFEAHRGGDCDEEGAFLLTEHERPHIRLVGRWCRPFWKGRPRAALPLFFAGNLRPSASPPRIHSAATTRRIRCGFGDFTGVAAARPGAMTTGQRTHGEIGRVNWLVILKGNFTSQHLAKPIPECYIERMNGQEILARLRDNETTLRARGVSHAALFGSRARGDDRPDSDIDIMIEVDPAAGIGVYEYAALKDYIAELFDDPVDVVSREGLKPYVRPAATTDAIYAF